MKYLGILAGLVLLIMSTSVVASGAWTNKIKVEIVSTNPGANAVYIVFSGHDDFTNACSDSTGALRYLRMDTTKDTKGTVYSTALTLYATGNEARAYVDNENSGKCSIVVLQACSANSSCLKF